MKRFTFFLAAIATMASLVASLLLHQDTRVGNCPGLRYRNPARIPRLEMDLVGS